MSPEREELESLRAERRLWNSEWAALESRAANARRQAILRERRIDEIEGRESKPDPLMSDKLQDGAFSLWRRPPLHVWPGNKGAWPCR